MANEINISAISGLTVTVQLYNGLVAVGGPFAATEIGTTGEYLANMPSVPYGKYTVLAISGPDKICSGQMLWDGAYEIIEGIAILQGLNPSAPSTTNVVTRKWTAGAIVIDMTGDLLDVTTMTRE